MPLLEDNERRESFEIDRTATRSFTEGVTGRVRGRVKRRVSALIDQVDKDEVKKNPALVAQAAWEVVRDAAFLRSAHGDIIARKRRKSFLSNNIPRPASLNELSVLTLNVWVIGAVANLPSQVTCVREKNPDIILLQEAFHMTVVDGYRHAFPDYDLVAFGRNLTPVATFGCFLFLSVGSTILFVPTIMVLFVSGTPSLRTWYVWFIVWLLCFFLATMYNRYHYYTAFLMGNVTGMVMLVRKHKFDGVSTTCATFSYEALQEDFLNGFRPRGYLTITAELKDQSEGPPLKVRVATTHLNQPPQQPPNKGRHLQVRELFSSCLHDDELFILGADLNATPPGTLRGTQCNTYVDMTSELTDAWLQKNGENERDFGYTWDQAGNPMCRSATNAIFYGTERLQWRCDYVMWRHRPKRAASNSRSVKLRSCELVFKDEEAVSDHFGIFAVFDIYRECNAAHGVFEP
eukprot:TRINITY_DN14063_c0_g1_i1.p1 TRINITY_DN14063_c0_g1~~TRINITY_DN14063_c0_g1_i1.p1  ORF type:complete len:461 (-),score=52.23 TRINITY_DN14063_c0_g1_i1:46-1428(-)